MNIASPILSLTTPAEPPTARRRRTRWIEAGLIIGFWAFIFVLTVGQRIVDPRGGQEMAPMQALYTATEFLVWLLLTPAIFWLSRRFSFDRTAWQPVVLLHLGIALVVAVLVDLYTAGLFEVLLPGVRRFPAGPVQRIVDFRFLDELFIFFVVLAAGFARDYFWRYRERHEEATQLRMQAAELEARLSDARLHALRMQINPHFLFNTLHAVSTLVERDPPGVRRMIARLSELLRYTLDHTSSQEVPLRDEVEFLHRYLEIQLIRFQDRLEVIENVDPEVMDALVPTLLLQPLVENAVKHGVSDVETIGRIELSAWREGDRLHFRVHDNGPGLDVSARPGVGLSTTRERLQNLYGEAAALHLRSGEPSGLLAEVTLPYHTGDDLRTSSVGEIAAQ